MCSADDYVIKKIANQTISVNDSIYYIKQQICATGSVKVYFEVNPTITNGGLLNYTKFYIGNINKAKWELVASLGASVTTVKSFSADVDIDEGDTVAIKVENPTYTGSTILLVYYSIENIKFKVSSPNGIIAYLGNSGCGTDSSSFFKQREKSEINWIVS